MVTIYQIRDALQELPCSGEKPDLNRAISEIKCNIAILEELEVKGKANLDTLLGCILALEQILGTEE